jgi:putative SOS response-associated peptidase YedK
MVTTAANSTILPIDDRMPAILEGDALSLLCLNPKTDSKDRRGLLEAARDDLLEPRRVSSLLKQYKEGRPGTAVSCCELSDWNLNARVAGRP